jgi:hypothetical protein
LKVIVVHHAPVIANPERVTHPVRRPRKATILPVALALSYPLLHLWVSERFDALSQAIGWPQYNRLMLWAMPAVLAVALIGGSLVPWGEVPTRWTWMRLAGVGGLAVAAQVLLVVANVELIHFPQYALLVGVLGAAGLAPEAAYWAATGWGAMDELYQHLVIYSHRPGTYLDLNDMVLNALGAAFAALLLRPRPAGASSARWLAALAGGVGCLAWPRPSWRPW